MPKEKPERWQNTWAEKKKKELSPESSKQPESSDRPKAKEYRHGWNSTGTSGKGREFQSCITNTHNAIEGAKYQADKDTPEARKIAHRQLDAAMKDLEQARQIAEEDRRGRTGNGLLDFLGLNFDNPSTRPTPPSEPEPEEPAPKADSTADRQSGKTGNGFLDFLGLNFDNPSNRQ
jgi:hypothetical protein